MAKLIIKITNLQILLTMCYLKLCLALNVHMNAFLIDCFLMRFYFEEKQTYLKKHKNYFYL